MMRSKQTETRTRRYGYLEIICKELKEGLDPRKLDKRNRGPIPKTTLYDVLDVLESSGAIYRDKDGLYYWYCKKEIENAKEELNSIVRELSEKFSKKLQELNEKIENYGVRIKHTEEIKERVIRPWIAHYIPTSYPIDRDYYVFITTEYEKYRIINYKLDPLYNDLLLNHIPEDLERPDLIEKECKEVEEESIKIEKRIRTEIERKIMEKCEGKVDIVRHISPLHTGLYLDPLASLFFEYVYTKKVSFMLERYETLDKILKYLEESPGDAGLKYYRLDRYYLIYQGDKSKREVAEIVFSIIEDREFRDLLFTSEFKLDESKKRVRLKREELIKILRELEAYEPLPGMCKYLRGW